MIFGWSGRGDRGGGARRPELRVTPGGDRDLAYPSLFVAGGVQLPEDGPEAGAPARLSGRISEIGFAAGWDAPLGDMPRRSYDFSKTSMCSDRFLSLERDEAVRGLAIVSLREAAAYDEQYRGALNHTGFELVLALRPDAFDAVRAHLEAAGDGGLTVLRRLRLMVLRLPSAPFPFPLPRGDPDPWNVCKDAIGALRPIRRFEIDRLSVTPRSVSGVPAGEAGTVPVIERYRALLGETLSLSAG